MLAVSGSGQSFFEGDGAGVGRGNGASRAGSVNGGGVGEND